MVLTPTSYYKNVGSESAVQWSSDVMKNLSISDIASYDYTGKRIKPEITVKQGDKVLKKGVDYTLSYGSNVLPGQGTVVVKGKEEYADFGSYTQYFVINKIDNPLKVTCEDVSYGTEIQPEVVNPSLGDLMFAYKVKGEEDYTDVIPTEPGEYTLRVTSDYTACYKEAVADVDFVIGKKDPVIAWPAAGAIPAGQSLAEAALTGGEADVEGSFAWKDVEIKPSVADSQKTKYVVVFTPVDIAHYNTMEMELMITVTEEPVSPSPSATASQVPNVSDAPQVTNEPDAPNGQKITVNKQKYVIKRTANGKKSVVFTGSANSKIKTVSIPAKVTYQGIDYSVTEISANAFAGNKSLTNVSIGASVTKIGKKAFYHCKNLKKIVIKSIKIKTFGSKAFQGINKSAKFKLPGSQKKTYEKKIEESGFDGFKHRK